MRIARSLQRAQVLQLSIAAGALFLALGTAAVELSAQASLAIVNATIIDGNGGPPISSGVVVIRGDRIVSVGSLNQAQVPPGTEVIDARGKTLLPGLADMHVHLVGGWDGETTEMLGFQRYLNALLYAGVTTVLDLGNVLPYVQQLRDETAAGRVVGPHIKIAGPLIDGADAAWPDISVPIASVAQMSALVKRLKQSRVDVVKGYTGLSQPQLTTLVREASAQSLPVIADVGFRSGTTTIANTGIAAFAHLGRVDVTPDAIDAMRNRQVATITTLAVFEFRSGRRLANTDFLSDPLLADTMPAQFQQELKAFAAKPKTEAEQNDAELNMRRFKIALANVKRLSDAGLLVVAGTDAPYPGDYYGEGLHRELELLVEAGLTPLQAITSATRNAAALLKGSGEWGTLTVGRRADLLMVNGDPSKRISDTRKVERVLRSGRWIDRSKLRFDPRTDPGFRAAGTTP